MERNHLVVSIVCMVSVFQQIIRLILLAIMSKAPRDDWQIIRLLRYTLLDISYMFGDPFLITSGLTAFSIAILFNLCVCLYQQLTHTLYIFEIGSAIKNNSIKYWINRKHLGQLEMLCYYLSEYFISWMHYFCPVVWHWFIWGLEFGFIFKNH